MDNNPTGSRTVLCYLRHNCIKQLPEQAYQLYQTNRTVVVVAAVVCDRQWRWSPSRWASPWFSSTPSPSSSPSAPRCAAALYAPSLLSLFSFWISDGVGGGDLGQGGGRWVRRENVLPLWLGRLHAYGLSAFVLILLTQVAVSAATRCLCCGRGLAAGGSRTCVISTFVISWWVFAISPSSSLSLFRFGGINFTSSLCIRFFRVNFRILPSS